MGSFWALVCSTVSLLVLLSSASRDERNYEQREITFDLHQKEMGVPDSHMMQREIDWTELLDPIEQRIVYPPEQFDTLSERGGAKPGVLKPRGQQPGVGPRSFGGPIPLDFPVQFPLSRPTSDNLQAICLHGDRRPRYPDSYFPASGFGKQRRKATAVNNAESWFSTCCNGNQTWGREVTLCCATQAWELSVKSFCKDDSSVKDRQERCCRLTDSDRLSCFDGEAPNPNYEPTEEIPMPPLPSAANFNFYPNTCQRTVLTPYRARGNRGRKTKKIPPSQKVDIDFPPGRPTADTIDSLCHSQSLRPLYNVKCLSGYELLARQAKTINRMEKGFKQCCKKKQGVLNCADQKWTEELNKFCLDTNGGQVDFHCCVGDGENDRYNCFQNISPDPHYNLTSATEEFSLNKICDTHKMIKKRFPVGFPLKSFVGKCCPLSEEDKTICVAQKLEEMSATLCSSGKASPAAVRRCCRGSSQEAPQCISKILMDAITKATNALRQKKKKRCPIS
ncbi:extracellular matrix protein 1-like protein [Lates japonicus]|uniref:Extracellular matrix protein 1-like protein n=1 Tax=Lates japonicus TaxID=270547 RepID=A0AAD3RCS1_LATJO|nr:extracellular matrix protein 1-like protein [Lates japonicus]